MEDVLVHMITEPEALKKGLEALTGTVVAFIKECMSNGAHVVHYLATRASREIVTIDQYREFGGVYDEAVFREVPNAPQIAHICGVEPLFEIAEEWRKTYKIVKGVSWWSQGSTPNLVEAKARWGDMCLVAGIDHANTFIIGKPADVEKEVAQSCHDAMEGGGFILAPGCEPSPKTSKENLKAAVMAARKHGKY